MRVSCQRSQIYHLCYVTMCVYVHFFSEFSVFLYLYIYLYFHCFTQVNDHVSGYTKSKPHTKLSMKKPSFPRTSTLLKPTASHLAKQNHPPQAGYSRLSFSSDSNVLIYVAFTFQLGLLQIFCYDFSFHFLTCCVMSKERFENSKRTLLCWESSTKVESSFYEVLGLINNRKFVCYGDSSYGASHLS